MKPKSKIQGTRRGREEMERTRRKPGGLTVGAVAVHLAPACRAPLSGHCSA